MTRSPITLILFCVMSSLISCSFPDEKITENTKNDACRQDVLGALSAFSSDLGLPIQISPKDATVIFDHGEVSKSYGRDGYKYTVTFGLETKEDGCNLVFYKKEKVGPGHESTTKSDFGSVLLTACGCENRD